MDEHSVLLAERSETVRFGTIIGNFAATGDVFYLNGDLGSGKTTLTKSIAAAIGIPATSVTSPTFALIHEYHGGRLPLYHLDLYRLNTPHELDHIGFDDYIIRADGVVVVEWASRAAERLPEESLVIHLSMTAYSEHARTASITATGRRPLDLAQSVMRAFHC